MNTRMKTILFERQSKMGALGAVSRLCGEAFGSAMTFANPGTASAPGQVPLDVVDTVLDSLRLS